MSQKIIIPGVDESYTLDQFRRLQSLERSARINKVVLETFDWWTDAVFIATLYQYSLEDSSNSIPFLKLLASTTSSSDACNDDVVAARDFDLFFKLFVASVVVLFANFTWRLFVALSWGARRRSHIQGCREWLSYIGGVVVTIIEPNNGLQIIDSVMDEGGRVSENERKFLKREIQLQMSLIFAENLPQFVIQLIYGIAATGDYAISWYVTTIVTVLHLLAQIIEVFASTRRYYLNHGENALSPIEFDNEPEARPSIDME